MRPLFDKLIAELKAQNAFRDMQDAGAPMLHADVRRPRFEGDFATSTDASKLFEEGVNVPQEALNLTRLSTTKALEKCMPDWAVQEWLAHFLKRPDLHHLASAALDKFKPSIEFIPVANRRPKKFFDYRVMQGGSNIDKRNALFSDAQAQAAMQSLIQQPHIALGILLWQFALQSYAHELAEYALKSDAPEPLKGRLVGFCRFLSTSAFMLASFGALLPLAIVAYQKTDAVNDAATALEEFSSRGGFMKHEQPKLFPYFQKALVGFFKKQIVPFAKPFPLKPRVIICSAKEAIPRWAGLQINNQGSLSAYIGATENLSKQSVEWKSGLETVRQLIGAGGNTKLGCPFHGRQGAQL